MSVASVTESGLSGCEMSEVSGSSPVAAQASTVAGTGPVNFAGVPTIYVNGFASNASGVDMTLIGMLNNLPQIGVVMTHSAAKTLVGQITKALEHIEQSSGVEVRDLDEINATLLGHSSTQ